MSRHHPVKVSYRQKGREVGRTVRCVCGCDWAAHDRQQPTKPCTQCGCAGFQVRPRDREAR